MKGFVFAHQAQHSFHQFVSTQIAQFTQRDSASQMRITIRVASGAAQRTLSGDLDRKHGDSTHENPAPCREDLTRSKARVWQSSAHTAFDALAERQAAFIFWI